MARRLYRAVLPVSGTSLGTGLPFALKDSTSYSSSNTQKCLEFALRMFRISGMCMWVHYHGVPWSLATSIRPPIFRTAAISGTILEHAKGPTRDSLIENRLFGGYTEATFDVVDPLDAFGPNPEHNAGYCFG